MKIYLITNIQNWKIYVGKYEGLRTIDWYLNANISKALRGSNDKPYLYKAMRKYGKQAFIISELPVPIKDPTREDLCSMECLFISGFRSQDPSVGYNISAGGDGNGSRPRPESIEKMRKSHLGRRPSAASSVKRSSSMKQAYAEGRKKVFCREVSSAEREQKRVAMLGNSRTLGYRHTTAAKQKISQAGKGRKSPKSPIHRKRISEALCKLSSEQVQEMRSRRAKEYLSYGTIAVLYGVSPMTAYNAVNGRRGY